LRPPSITASSVGRVDRVAGGLTSRSSSTAARDSVEMPPSSPRTTIQLPSADSSVPSVTRSPRLCTRTRLLRADSIMRSPFSTS